MRTMIPLFCSILLLIGNIACTKESIPQPRPSTSIALDQRSASIVKSDNQFGFDIFKKIDQETDVAKNLMISPLSISQALAMVYNGAAADTKTEFETVLKKSGFTTDEINQSYSKLTKSLVNHDPSVELSIANSIWYRNTFNVLPEFINTNQNYYNAEVKALDFTNTSAVLNTVNSWVNDKTKGKIPTILSKVNSEDVMYLINAIYFKGSWSNHFDNKSTTNADFFKLDRSTVKVPMMKQKNKMSYYENNDFQLARIPYGDGKFSMIILVPTEGHSIQDITAQFTNDNFNNWISQLDATDVTLYLPKFEFSYNSSLIPALEDLGLKKAFIDGVADFSGISKDQNPFISAIAHKTYIKTNEEGSEAAAITSITVGVTAAMPTQEKIINANRPFVFVIHESDTNSVLFMGKVMNPLIKE